MLPIDRKAYTIRSDNYPTIIIINESDFNMKVLNMSNYLLKHVLDYNIAVEGKVIYGIFRCN